MGRNPEECAQAGGRWDDGTFSVLYTSIDKQGAIEEKKFHLLRGQPVLPSKVSYQIFALQVQLRSVYSLDLERLNKLGLDPSKFGRLSYFNRIDEYPTSQLIAEACFFLGADGLVVPNARHTSSNVIVFCDQTPKPFIEVVSDPESLNF